MTERKPPPRGITCVIQHLANSYAISESFQSTREDEEGFGTVRLDKGSLLARLARAERSLPRGRVTIGAYEVWFLERGPEIYNEYDGEEQFLDGLEGVLGGEIPSFLGLSGNHYGSFGTILNLINPGGRHGSGDSGAGDDLPWGGGSWGGESWGGSPWGGSMGTGQPPADWLGWMISGLSGFLGGVGARTGFIAHGWDEYSGTTPNKYGGHTNYEGGSNGRSWHSITVYDSNGTKRESTWWITDSEGNDFYHHHKWDENGNHTYHHYQRTSAEEKELAEAAWNWFGGDSNGSDSESMTVDDGDDARERGKIPPDVEQVSVAWEVATTFPFDEDDIGHLPIDPASGARAAPEAFGIGFVTIGQTLDGGEEPIGDSDFKAPGGDLGVPLRTKEYEPAIWYQIHVIDPPDLELVVASAQRPSQQ